MGTYNLPRNVKGEGRIFFIFSAKGLIMTCAGLLISLPFNFILGALKLKTLGIIISIAFGIIGCAIEGLEITRKAGGENIDDVIKRYIKFKMNKKKYYVYTKEEK